jgi:hypothetical protein
VHSDKSSAGESSGSVHWSKDYVEHLRSVHFALVALSLAVIVLGSSSSRTEIATAREEIQDIAELRKVWNEQWLEEEASTQLSATPLDRLPSARFVPNPPDAKVLIASFTGGPHTARIPVTFDGVNWAIDGPIRDLQMADQDANVDRLRRAVLLKDPRSLEDFRNTWDALNEETVIVVPVALGTTVYENNAESEQITRWGEGAADYQGEPLTLALRASVKNTDAKPKTRYLYEYSSGQQAHTAIRVASLQTIRLDAQGALIKHFRGSDSPHILIFRESHLKPAHGPFSGAFRALYTLSANYQSLAIDKIDAILAAEQSRAGESFEAFGVKFPAEGTTRWGIILLLAVQLYFWIHLHELSQKLKPRDEGWEVAWIGVYPSAAARIIFRVSAFLLPLCAILIIGIRGLLIGNFAGAYWVLLLVGAAASIFLSAVTWARIPKRQ